MRSTTRARNRPGEGERLRDEIVDAADRLLADAGSASRLSLRAIAREVGITAPAIYAHFSTKEQLLSAVVARRFAGLARALHDAAHGLAQLDGSPAAQRSNAIATVRARTRAYVDYGLQHPGVYAVLFGPEADHLGLAFEGSPGEEVFAALLDPVSVALEGSGSADPLAVATDLWVAMHGVVALRSSQAGFVWGDLDEQLDRMVTRLLVR
jgi:AcrR family transcriptional regulator